MNPISKNIIDFLHKNKVATVCFINKLNQPYCINCFYCFIENNIILIFKSSPGALHDAYIITNNYCSGTIIADQIDISNLKGVQFTGKLLDQKEIYNKKLHFCYLQTFPLSIYVPGYLWGVQIEYIKFTDNSLGFGNKTLWFK